MELNGLFHVEQFADILHLMILVRYNSFLSQILYQTSKTFHVSIYLDCIHNYLIHIIQLCN